MAELRDVQLAISTAIAIRDLQFRFKEVRRPGFFSCAFVVAADSLSGIVGHDQSRGTHCPSRPIKTL
jgi:hypothetical protein